MKNFTFFKQFDSSDYGFACVKMTYCYGKNYNNEYSITKLIR